MNYGLSGGGKTGLSSFESCARRAKVVAPTGKVPRKARTNGLGYVPDDGDTLMGGWSIKKPFGSKKSIFNQVFNVVAAPVRIASAVALQTVGLKNLASDIKGTAISSNLLKSIGQVTQTAAAIGGAIIAAPVVASAVSGAAGLVASGVSAVVGAAPTVATTLAAAKTLIPGGAQEQEQPQAGAPEVVNAQEFYDKGVADASARKERVQQANAVANDYYNQGYDDMVTAMRSQEAPAAVAQQEVAQAVSGNAITGVTTKAPASYAAYQQEPPYIPSSVSINESEIGKPLSLRDAPVSKTGSLIPAEFKPYLPYAVGGLTLVILAGVLRRPATVANPYKRY